MKKLFIIVFVASCLLGCIFKRDEFIRKKLHDNQITIKWYYYSDITDNSPDFIEIKKGTTKELLYKSPWEIIDVNLRNDTIYLKLVNTNLRFSGAPKIKDQIWEYKIIVDSTGVTEDLLTIPDGVKG